MTTATKTTASASQRLVCRLALIIAFLALVQCGTAASIIVPGAIAGETAVPQSHGSGVPRPKRMYAMCPPHFERIGQQCYYVSHKRLNWLDAHFECKDRNGKLAELNKLEDRRLRRFMQTNDTAHATKWIGGLFNWQKNLWQWGYSGETMTYQSFSQMMPGSRKDLKFHCAILNADLKYRWSARPCVELHQFVCQHKMPYVSEANRYKVYERWNATYPNEMASEIVEYVHDRPNTRRRSPLQLEARPANPQTARRFRPKRPQNGTLFSDGRFIQGRLHQDLNMGRPLRRPQPRRPRPSTTTVRPAPGEVSNSLDTPAQPHRDDERLASEKRLNAARRAEHRRKKQEHARQAEQRRREQDEHRQQQRDEHRTTEAPTTVRSTTLSIEQLREERRLAESRRVLGIAGPPAPVFDDPLRTRPATSTLTTTSTAAPTTATDDGLDSDERAHLAEERRLQAEEQRQRDELDRRQREYQQQQEEYRRQEAQLAEQRERDRVEAQRRADEADRQRNEQEQRIQAEIRERKERERIELEQSERLAQERREQQDKRRAELAERQSLKAAREAELRRLKEKSDRNNEIDNDTTMAEIPTQVADEAQRRKHQEALEKKRKREKLRAKLAQMSDEQKMEFFALRAERNKKRHVENGESAIPK